MTANPRLTNTIRRTIKDHLLDDRFGAEQERIEKMVAQIGLLAYEVAFTKQVRDAISKISGAWFYHSCSIQVGIDGEREYYSFGNKGDEEDADSISLPMPYNDKFSVRDEVSMNSRSEYKGRKKKLFDLVRGSRIGAAELSKNRREAEVKIEAVLEAATNRNKLIELWPEIAPTLDRIWKIDQPIKTVKTLAVKMDVLNETLGLPEVEGK